MTDRDTDWRPDASLDVLRTRADLLRRAREFFAERDVLEVETPALAEYGVTDPNIAGLAIRVDALPGREYFLQTSPEYAMKRLLAAGSPDIYQICRVFRDGEIGSRHQPEFTMVEWYRRDLSLDDMIAETCLLIATLFAVAPAGGAALSPTISRRRYSEIFAEVTDLDPLDAGVDLLRKHAIELVPGLSDELVRQLGDERGGWLDLLMSHVVVPRLPARALSVIHHYPATQAALARLDSADPRFAERFEVFYDGIELANGYRELTDPAEQRERFAADRHRREAAGLADVKADERLLAALDHGLPECCGVAVGFDRVLMCALGAKRISDVISFAL